MAEPENFDALYNGNQTFVLGGETFRWEPLHWREWGTVVDARVAEEEEKAARIRAEVARLMETGLSEDEAEIQADENLDDTSLVQTIEKVIERCLVYVADDDVEKFKTIVNDPAKKITYPQLSALTIWLQEVQSPDRPTNTPEVSSPGAGTTGATSQAA